MIRRFNRDGQLYATRGAIRRQTVEVVRSFIDVTSCCADCGAPFTFTTTLGAVNRYGAYLRRRCDACKAPGVPVDRIAKAAQGRCLNATTERRYRVSPLPADTPTQTVRIIDLASALGVRRETVSRWIRKSVIAKPPSSNGWPRPAIEKWLKSIADGGGAWRPFPSF